MDFSDKVALVIDGGPYTELAVRLGRDFGMVYYFTHWRMDYPTNYEKSIGKGLEDEGVERVNDYESILKEVSKDKLLIVIPEGNSGHLVEDLRARGFRVWGGGRGEKLEYDRVFAKEFMKELDMPVNTYKEIIGMEELKKYLMDPKNEDKYIKSDVRGDFESFHHEKWRLTEPLFSSIWNSLGATRWDYKFIVEDPIPDAVEYGYDGFSIDGQYPKNTLFGIELKDSFYLGKVKPMEEISDLVTGPMYKIAPFLKTMQYRQTISSEVRITPKKENFVIDWTCGRFPSPPGEIYYELWKNFCEILWFGAEGKLIEPEYASKFAIEGIIHSSWAAGDGEQAIYFPNEIRKWVKIKNLYKHNDIYYFIPLFGGYAEIGGVVALDNTIEGCIEKLKELSEQIEGYKISINVGDAKQAMDVIAKGKELGITF